MFLRLFTQDQNILQLSLIHICFEPFDGESVNPELEAVKGLPERIGDAEIVKAEIPVVFGRAGEKLAEAVAACTPDIVLCIGQAGGASVISVERIAVNLIDARIADNDGKQPVDVPVKEDVYKRQVFR